MQYIDNDMDDVFKKAGEEYPLRTEGADWDAVLFKMNSATETARASSFRKLNRNYFWLLLLLLIPLGYCLNEYYGRREFFKTGIEEWNNSSADVSEKNKKSGNSISDLPVDPLRNTKEKTGFLNELAVQSNRGFKSLDQKSMHPELKSLDQKGVHPELKSLDKKSIHPGLNLPYALTEQSTGEESKKNKADNISSVPTTSSNTREEQESIPVDSTTAIYTTEEVTLSSRKGRDTIAVGRKSEKKRREKIKNKIKGFYLGILMGPDFSTIQSQKFTSMGYSAGLLAGYRINKHWAVEAGAIWDRKKYYTDGKYFDKSGANIPPNVMVHYLNGVCEMFEFPVVVRYNINLQKNLLFATAGLTSYIMRKESYRYGAMSNGSYYEGYRSYKRSGNTLFANMHMSAGYDYGLSANWSVRVEPYINLPLKNIGVGKMPISSKGVYIGITRAIK